MDICNKASSVAASFPDVKGGDVVQHTRTKAYYIMDEEHRLINLKTGAHHRISQTFSGRPKDWKKVEGCFTIL